MADVEYLTVTHLNRQEIRRIFSKIDIDAATGCWNWRPEPKRIYGRMKLFRQEEMSHRVLYAWLVGPLPRGLGKDIPQLDHVICDNTRCCCPWHVTLSTARDNTLRSSNAAAENARKTHCKNGHPLPDERNSWDGGRECKVCKTASHRSTSFVAWNKEFGRRYHASKRYGPGREEFLRHQREVLADWLARNPHKKAEYNKKNAARKRAKRHASPKTS